jgi:hypothetical protein
MDWGSRAKFTMGIFLAVWESRGCQKISHPKSFDRRRTNAGERGMLGYYRIDDIDKRVPGRTVRAGKAC